jgi:TRAP-type mannitol/chloroaromatic compound transport system substrate-binding protein
MFKDHTRSIVAAGLAGSVALVAALDAGAQERVRWKMSSAFGSQVPVLGTTGVAFSERISQMSGGNFQIKFHEPGALVPGAKEFEPVSKGAVDAGWTTPGYHTHVFGGAVAFFTAVPFGPSLGEFQAWKRYGGGDELREELYNAHGVTSVDSFCIGPETSGWFREEVTNPTEYFKGLKMRFFGLGAKVMQKMGASTQLLAGADIFPALEKGVIDATEFSMPITDIKYGFHQVASYNYFPGWHQQISCSELIMNKEKYDALPNTYKAMIQAAAAEQVVVGYAETEATNPLAMIEMGEKHGVHVKRWDDETLAILERAWLEVIAEESAKDPVFKKIADSYLAFRETYRIWGDAQSLDGTYQE